MKEYLDMNMSETVESLDKIKSNTFSQTVLMLKIAQYLERISNSYLR